MGFLLQSINVLQAWMDMDSEAEWDVRFIFLTEKLTVVDYVTTAAAAAGDDDAAVPDSALHPTTGCRRKLGNLNLMATLSLHCDHLGFFLSPCPRPNGADAAGETQTETSRENECEGAVVGAASAVGTVGGGWGVAAGAGKEPSILELIQGKGQRIIAVLRSSLQVRSCVINTLCVNCPPHII